MAVKISIEKAEAETYLKLMEGTKVPPEMGYILTSLKYKILKAFEKADKKEEASKGSSTPTTLLPLGGFKMRCSECGKRIPWCYYLNPWTINYTLQIKYANGSLGKPEKLCKSCGEKFSLIQDLVNLVGEEEAFKILDKLDKEETPND